MDKIIRELHKAYDIFNERKFNGEGVRDGLLKFDFAIFEDKEQNKLKCLIEYDGEFHYKKYYVEQNFEIQQIHDQRKDNYCKEHNIKLIRIPYWEQENLLHILKEKLK
ncbi:hypothetical protein G8S49_06570 [Clostridium botulinum C]|uniref:Uncharacterized protein n=2 Tax=Clostridium botulinum TaxID=1491 RepID=A0A9Q4TQL8_CLOBO|nr:hypothetical protein [Clostridium botulinum]YP_398470.1 homing endonuclease [Clostridium phage c-st]MCD3196064.1 hypothetical protein [Clostridium botulinum C]MCD3200355.1 hypothetical protein [Clostridium botulinum C]MCD3206888.1 hypothetical protein [Clostridium botulinum C]MCD3207587.1 hypothetical protein [Clostridium botulinum C]MCD3226321.1 hypothetical protein [Clostridium botulinum C]